LYVYLSHRFPYAQSPLTLTRHYAEKRR
jgi:hypothetical protein